MFPSERQLKLDPVLTELRKINGIDNVSQDDYDSAGINVFFWLNSKSDFDGRALEFVIPLISLRSRLNKLFKKLGVEFSVIDYPTMTYAYVPSSWRMRGDKSHVKIGYDQNRYGIEVIV